MPGLTLRCRICEREFASGYGSSEEAYEAPHTNGQVHQCPTCGAERRYSPSEYVAEPPGPWDTWVRYREGGFGPPSTF